MKEGWSGVGAWVLVHLATGILCDLRQVLLSRHSFLWAEVVGPGCGDFCCGWGIVWPWADVLALAWRLSLLWIMIVGQPSISPGHTISL